MKKTLLFALTLCFVGTPLARAGDPFHPEDRRPTIENAKAMFTEVDRLVKKEFVDKAASEDDARWSQAIHGMLKGLGPNNQLLTPEDLKVMKGSVKGSIKGIGVAFEKVQDLVIVREVLPNAPASGTRMQANDRILAVDGKFLAEASMMDIVQMIRGEEGTSVELLMQRGTEEWTETITRGSITYHSVQFFVRPDRVGYLRITSFTETVPKDLDAALAQAKKADVQSMVLDLRNCPGGLFNVSTDVADRFLSRGRTIVSVKRRDGTTETFRAKDNAAFTGKLVVLVNEKSASSAEILAAALSENGRATLVGEKTFGKGTVEKIFELSGGFGLKLTVSRFYSPDGNNWQDKGIEPAFVIPSDFAPKPAYTKEPAQDLEQDAQLKAALGVLKF